MKDFQNTRGDKNPEGDVQWSCFGQDESGYQTPKNVIQYTAKKIMDPNTERAVIKFRCETQGGD